MAPNLRRREREERKDASGNVCNSTLMRVARGNESSHNMFAQSCSPEVSGEFPAQARICGYSDDSSRSHSGRQQIVGGGSEGQDGHSRSNSGPAVDRLHSALPTSCKSLPANTLLLGSLQRQLLCPLSSSVKVPRGGLAAPKQPPPPSPLNIGGTCQLPASLTSGGDHSLTTGRGSDTTAGDMAVGSRGQGSVLGCLGQNGPGAEGQRSKDSNTVAGRSKTTETTSAQMDKRNGTKRTMDDGSNGGSRHKPWPSGDAPPPNVNPNGNGVDKPSDMDVATEGEGAGVGVETNDVPDYAFVALCGRRAKMGDKVAAVPRVVLLQAMPRHQDAMDEGSREEGPEHLHFFGVYDGHGGAEVPVHCAANLHHKFADRVRSTVEGNQNDIGSKETFPEQPQSVQASIESALVVAFDEIDAEVGGTLPETSTTQVGRSSRVDAAEGMKDVVPESGKEPLVNDSVGTTAICAVLSQSHLTLANCGDSRAVLGRGGETVVLTVDHKFPPEIRSTVKSEWKSTASSRPSQVQANGRITGCGG